MEHPYHSRISDEDFHYSEQVILLDGQGIFYDNPEKHEALLKDLKSVNIQTIPTRDSIGLSVEDFIFFIPQNSFKIHPLFDYIIKRILEDNPGAHIVLLKDDKKPQEVIFINRLSEKINKNDLNRIHFIKRVQPQYTYELITEFANVVLHPFPFDGSKTSIDVLYVSKPFITLPGEFLRGRMASSYLRTMNIPELLAYDALEYIEIANKLYSNPLFYNQIIEKININKDLIYEDMLVPFSFNNFLLRLSGKPLQKLDQFIRSVSNNNNEYNDYLNKIQRRHKNSKLFDEIVRKQDWMLDKNNKVIIKQFLEDDEVPLIFKSFFENEKNKLKINNEKEEKFVNDFNNSKWLNSLERIELYDNYQLENYNYKLFIKNLYSLYSSDKLFLLDICTISFLKNDYEASIISCYKSINKDFNPSLSYQLLALSCFYYDRSLNSSNINKICYPDNNQYNEAEKYFLLANSFYDNNKLTNFLTYDNNYNFYNKNYDNLLDILESYKKVKELNENNNNLLIKNFFYPLKLTQNSIFTTYLTTLKNNLKYNTCIKKFFKFYNIKIETKNDLILNLIPAIFLQFKFDFSINRRNLSLSYQSILNYFNIPFKQRKFSDFITKFELFQTNLNFIPIVNECIINSEDLKDISFTIYQEIQKLIQILRLQGSIYENSIEKYKESEKLNIHLITQYYLPNDKNLQKNLDLALQKNLYNNNISKIYLLTENYINFDKFYHSSKIEQIVINKRLTFADAFTFANEKLNNSYTIISNADISFDHTLQFLNTQKSSSLLNQNGLYSLNKWILDLDDSSNSYILPLRMDSQDAWIFKSPLNLEYNKKTKKEFYSKLNFYLGLPRCDGRVNNILQEHSIYLYNIPYDIKIYEENYTRLKKENLNYSINNQVNGDLTLLPIIPSPYHFSYDNRNRII